MFIVGCAGFVLFLTLWFWDMFPPGTREAPKAFVKPVGAFVVLVIGGTILGQVTHVPSPVPVAPVTMLEQKPTVISRSQYGSLTMGTSYLVATVMIGSNGVEQSHNRIADIETVSYMWMNPDGSNAILIFQDDRLVSKAQAGLR